MRMVSSLEAVGGGTPTLCIRHVQVVTPAVALLAWPRGDVIRLP